MLLEFPSEVTLKSIELIMKHDIDDFSYHIEPYDSTNYPTCKADGSCNYADYDTNKTPTALNKGGFIASWSAKSSIENSGSNVMSCPYTSDKTAYSRYIIVNFTCQ